MYVQDINYLQKPAGECHGDEHLIDCSNCKCGDNSIWCQCSEELERERERINELYYDDLLRDV